MDISKFYLLSEMIYVIIPDNFSSGYITTSALNAPDTCVYIIVHKIMIVNAMILCVSRNNNFELD